MNREPADSRHVGEHFMEFAIDFFNLAKNSYHQQNQIRANSAAFQVLMQLNQPDRQAPTMSEMALQLGITKQQLQSLSMIWKKRTWSADSTAPGTGAMYI